MPGDDGPFRDLEPEAVWKHFRQVTQISRPSGPEEKIAAYISDWAANQVGATVQRDAARNVLVRIPATPGREAAAPVILQVHMDMVNVRNPSAAGEFDPALGRIQVIRADQVGNTFVAAPQGAYLKAVETSLGADWSSVSTRRRFWVH